MCAEGNQKDQNQKTFLVPSARWFRCGRPAGPSFLVRPRNEAKEGRPTKHEGPCAADNRVGGGRDWLVPRSQAIPRPACSSLRRVSRGDLSPVQGVAI